jgi:hypothetical protein
VQRCERVTAEDDMDAEEFLEDRYPEECEMNLQRHATMCLCRVSACLSKGAVLEMLLPYLKELLKQPGWRDRETAVVALGALLDGCDAKDKNLPALVPQLLPFLSDSNVSHIFKRVVIP